MLAVALEVTGGLVGGVIATLGVFGAAVGFVMWKARQMYLKLENHQAETQAKSQQAETEHREKVLQSYKEMYELEKERGTREIEDLRKQIIQLREELKYMTNRQREMAEEGDKLRELNLKYQDDKRKDGHTIANLQTEVGALKQQIEKLQNQLAA